jgi:redox-sensing transcriptional repressor
LPLRGHTVPDPAIRRICLYLRQLEHLRAEGHEKVSSRQLAEALHLSAAQVRKDLGYFGQFGRPGMGYEVTALIDQIRRILGTDRMTNVVVVGAGDLGRALLRYRGFQKKGFRVVAAFDVDQRKVGQKVGSVSVEHMDRLEAVIDEHKVRLAVLAVPVEAAQQVTDRLRAAGVKGILNFAPTILQTPPGLAVGPVDLAAYLEQLSFQVHSAESIGD